MRKATAHVVILLLILGISIPAFREEGDALIVFTNCLTFRISIPAFREEGDMADNSLMPLYNSISIPAFREEGDVILLASSFPGNNFNPRLP